MGEWGRWDINQLIIQNMQSCFERAVIYWHFLWINIDIGINRKSLWVRSHNESPINIPKHSAPRATGAARTITGFRSQRWQLQRPIENSFKGPIPTPPPPSLHSTLPSHLALAEAGPAGTDGIPEATHGYLWCHPRRHLGLLSGWHKMSEECGGGGVGQGSIFLVKSSMARELSRLEDGQWRGGRGHAGSGLLSAYISVLFWCGLRDLYICWAHKQSMWLHILSALLLWIYPGRQARASLWETVFRHSPSLAFIPLLNHNYLFQTGSKLSFLRCGISWFLIFVSLLPQDMNWSLTRLKNRVLKSDHPNC